MVLRYGGLNLIITDVIAVGGGADKNRVLVLLGIRVRHLA